MGKRRFTGLAKFFRLVLVIGVAWITNGVFPTMSSARDVTPWISGQNALIVDAYELNRIDWEAMLTDKRIAGFISKASDGLPERFACAGDPDGDTAAHCKTVWRKYAVSRELYQTRRMIARANGLLWGAYHLARPGNPVDQAEHFLDYAAPKDDELMVLDLEGIDPQKYMSLEDATIFVATLQARTGRYPMLYTNHTTALYIAAHRDQFPILSRLPLWYARYKPGIRDVFPMGNWDSYALWQFSSGVNCGRQRCPYRVAGTLNDIDVNVAAMNAAALKAVWAKGDLVAEKPFDRPLLIAAEGTTSAGAGIGVDVTLTGSIRRTDMTPGGPDDRPHGH